MNGLNETRLTDLALFARVVDAGGFTAASKLVGVPQTTISRRISSLEDSLEIRLLERTTRRVAPTEAGRKVYEHAKRIIEEMDGAKTVAASLRGEPSGLIRLTAPVVLGQHVIAPLIAEFGRKHPKISFQVDLTGRRVDLIEEGFDIAIRVGDLPGSSLLKIQIMKANAAYYATETIARRIKEPADLANFPWLNHGLETEAIDWRLVDPATGKNIDTFRKIPLVASSDVEILVHAARAGLGIASIPEFAAPNDLTRVLPTFFAKQVDINALVVSRKSIIPSIRALLDFLKAALQG